MILVLLFGEIIINYIYDIYIQEGQETVHQ